MTSKTGRVGKEKDDSQCSALHDAAKFGHTKKLKKILSKGVGVDIPNSSGQTPLFSACYNNQVSAALTLMKHGANPNERSLDGATSVHAACYSCNIKIVSRLLVSGGDLRLHDNLGRKPKDWIMLQSEPKKKYKMMEFIEKTRYFAMSGNSKETVKGSSSILERASDRTSSMIRFVRGKIKGDSSSSSTEVRSVQSMGFGKVYLDSESWQGMISIIPLVAENSLRHDNNGFTFNNGSFMVMESMTWLNTDVTVKRLHRKPQEGGHVDLLINESEIMGKIHHPNVLLFMGICQTNNLDGLVLLYERIGCGSLFHHIHDRFEGVSYSNFITLLKQICNALVFIHQQNLIHCTVSSHAINLITASYAKLGNFEYMVESSPHSIQKKSLACTNTFPNAVYNWLAPELMEDHPPVIMSDMYGLCMVIYEVFEDKIPWEDCSAGFIKQKLVTDGYSISCKSHNIPKLFQAVLELGLQFEIKERKLTFEQLQHLLITLSRREDTAKAKHDCDIENTELTAVSPVQASPGPSNASEHVLKESPIETSKEKEEDTQEPAAPVTLQEISVQYDKSANNSSSDFTQCDDPQSLGATSTCSQQNVIGQQARPRRSLHTTGKEVRLSTKRLKPSTTSFLEERPSGSIDMYKDTDDTFHYSVCLSRKSSQVQPSPRLHRNSTDSPSTLPRCQKPSIHGGIHKETAPSKRRTFPGSCENYEDREASDTREHDPSDRNCSMTSHYSSLPSVSTCQQDQTASPSALYKAITGLNQPKQAVEIVRDIKTELAMSRERKSEEHWCNPFRTPVRSSTMSSTRGEIPPIQFNYSSLRSATSQPIVKRAVKPASHGAEIWQTQPTAGPSTMFAAPTMAQKSRTVTPEKVQNNLSIASHKDEPGPSPCKPDDTHCYGGLGCVKNLVKKYQAESDLHQNKQAILEGKLTNSPSKKDRQSGTFRGALLLCQPKKTESDAKKVATLEKQPLETVVDTHNIEPRKASPTVSETDKSSIGSIDSGEVLAWVNYHLDRIKEDMARESAENSQDVAQTASVITPSDHPNNDLCGPSPRSSEPDLKIEILPNTDSFSNNKLEIAFSNTTATSAGGLVTEDPDTPTALIPAGKTLEKPEPEEFYFDDVIQPSLQHAKHLKLQGTSSVPNYTNSMAPTAQRGRTMSEDRQDGKKHYQKSNRIRAQGHADTHQKGLVKAQVWEPIPNDEVKTTESESGTFEGSTTVVSVRTSGNLPGKHTITHVETDLKTGVTETINKGTVRAQRVISQVYTK